MKCVLKVMAILLFGLLATSILSCGGGTYSDGTYYHPPTGYDTYRGGYWGGYPRGNYYHYRPLPRPMPAPRPYRR